VLAAVALNDSVGWYNGPDASMQHSLAIGLASVTVIIHAMGAIDAIAHLSRDWQRRVAVGRALPDLDLQSDGSFETAHCSQPAG
jgi:hypothetical protein